jgi:cell division protein FtsX
VLSTQGQVTDVTLYLLGKKDISELDEVIQAFSEGYSIEDSYDSSVRYSYDEFLGITFKLIGSYDTYVYDGEYKVWTDKSNDKRFMSQLIKNGEDLTIVGVVQPKEDVASPLLLRGINYPASLIDHLAENAAESEIVKAQLKRPEVNVITGVPFGEESERTEFDMGSLFKVDEEAIGEAFKFDMDELDMPSMQGFDLSGIDLSGMDLSGAIDPGDMASAMPSLTPEQVAELLGSVKINVTAEEMENLLRTVLAGYADYIDDDPSTDYSRLGGAVESFMRTEDAREILRNEIRDIISENSEKMITRSQLERIVGNIMAGYPDYVEANSPDGESSAALLTGYLRTPAVQTIITNSAAELREQVSSMGVSREQAEKAAEALYNGYVEYAKANDLPDPSKLSESVRGYMATPEAQSVISEGVSKALDTSELEKKAAEMMSSYTGAIGEQISKMMGEVMKQIAKPLTNSISKSLEGLMSGMTENFQSMFNVDPEAMANAFTANMDAEELRDLMMSLMSTEKSSFENNLNKLGYADLDNPSTITIYPINFDSKTRVKSILDGYNDMQMERGHDDKVIKYTDVADALISSVTTIVNAVSYVLIAFVGVSLVVSSIMIGVITYISVLERSKEIGILRAIGASKRNISQVFNAETFIIGGLAGLFGIGITWLLLIPVNIILRALTEQQNINAVLPGGAAAILVLLSICLTLIGGIIPSKKAARRDPVAALRSE